VPDNAHSDIAHRLLHWYDAHARVLPWRAPPGTPAPDPYRVWLSEVMLQQTQVTTVRPYFEKFLRLWPDFASLAAADDAEVMSAWAGLGYYARARNLLACARAVAALGALPDEEEGLRALPGIGGYTAAAIAAIAFGRRAVAVDANVERVVSRLFAIGAPLPASKPRIREAADSITPDTRAGDFAQAMMDLGSSICTARAPKCLICPLSGSCEAQRRGDAERFPRKLARTAKPKRYGTVFWAERCGQVLLVRRPDKGMLGGMRALPTGEWLAARPGLAGAPAEADWRLLDASVRHGFTHFDLECALAAARIDRQKTVDGEWWPIADLGSAGLPTLFAKAVRAMRRA